MSGPVIPGVARQDKKGNRKSNVECRLTADLLHAKPHESKMNQDNKSTTVISVLGICFLPSIFFPTAPERGVARKDKKKNRKEDCKNVRHMYWT